MKPGYAKPFEAMFIDAGNFEDLSRSLLRTYAFFDSSNCRMDMDGEQLRGLTEIYSMEASGTLRMQIETGIGREQSRRARAREREREKRHCLFTHSDQIC